MQMNNDASTEFDPNTGRRLKKGAVIFAVVLVVLFAAVRVDRFFKDRALAHGAQQTSAAPHLVDVVAAEPVGAVQHLALPGQTEAWHSSTIYARVSGYVGKWFV